MDIQIMEHKGSKIAVVRGGEIILSSTDNALDLIANACGGNECDKLVLFQKNIAEDFFELKTRIAGETLQKFTNYGVSVAIVGSFEKYGSKSLNDFIFECNKGKNVLFKGSLQEALDAF